MLLPLTIEVENLILSVLIQLSIIILTARLFAILMRKLKQPAVVGEIIAGLLLGPSFFGLFFPRLHSLIFASPIDPIGADATKVLHVLSQLGLILLLFLVGLEFDFRHLKRNARSAFGISLTGILVPFTLGILLAQYLYPRLGNGVDLSGFILFMGVSMSITALPVLARMMQEFQITGTRIGTITITAAASDDAAGWILLATVSALVTSQFHPLLTLRMILLTITFVLFLIYVAGPPLRKVARSAVQNDNGTLSLTSLALLMVALFCCAIVTQLIGIFAVFGAFLFGAVLSAVEEFRNAVARALQSFVTVFFLPIFFTYTGLRTNVTLLGTSELWILAILVWLTAIAGKFGGCSIAARLTGFPTKEALLIGTMMNTRGLMELIVLNVGYDLHVIPQSLFTILVLMAILTTIMTTPMVYLLKDGTELQSQLRTWWNRSPENSATA